MRPTDFPLCWPEGQPRTPADARRDGKFRISFEGAYDALVDEAEKLHDRDDFDVVVSTNLPLDKKERPILPKGDKTDIHDPGVCLYLWCRGKPFAISCDTYRDVRSNLRGVWRKLSALREGAKDGASALAEQSTIGHCHEVGAHEEPKLHLLSAAAAAG